MLGNFSEGHLDELALDYSQGKITYADFIRLRGLKEIPASYEPVQPKGPPTMNYSSAIFLVNDAVRAINVSYEIDAEGKGKRPYYTFKSLDSSLAVGDRVIVPTDTRHGFTVVRVEEVDVEVELETAIDFKWIVDRLDISSYSAVLAKEAEVISAVKSAEKTRKRRELSEKLLEDNPELQALRGVVTEAIAAPVEPPATT